MSSITALAPKIIAHTTNWKKQKPPKISVIFTPAGRINGKEFRNILHQFPSLLQDLFHKHKEPSGKTAAPESFCLYPSDQAHPSYKEPQRRPQAQDIKEQHVTDSFAEFQIPGGKVQDSCKPCDPDPRYQNSGYFCKPAVKEVQMDFLVLIIPSCSCRQKSQAQPPAAREPPRRKPETGSSIWNMFHTYFCFQTESQVMSSSLSVHTAKI